MKPPHAPIDPAAYRAAEGAEMADPGGIFRRASKALDDEQEARMPDDPDPERYTLHKIREPEAPPTYWHGETLTVWTAAAVIVLALALLALTGAGE